MKRTLIFGLSLILFLAGFAVYQPVTNEPIFVATAYQPSLQDSASQAEVFITQARTDGLNYLNSKDEKAKKSAKKNLDEATDLLKDAVKKDASCEKCYEGLVKAYLYKTYFGFEKNYEDCLEWSVKGLTKFPNNKQIHFHKGYAHYNAMQYSEANKAFNNFLVMAADDPQAEQVRKLLQDSQQKFMTGWYRQADFYNSKEAKIEATAQNFQRVTVFQVTPQWELQLGAQAFTQITSQSPAVQDPEVQAYVEGMVNKLVSRTPGPNFNYQVTILNSPTVNAMTVPGHVFVATGLLAYAESEAELVGVLSHEIAHNYGHHAARRFIKAYQAQTIANAVVSAVNPQNQMAQVIAQLAANIGVNLFVLAYDRKEEKEADLYGSHIMYNAGYDPTAISMFFTRMFKDNPKQPIRFLSTHPPVPDRASYMLDYVESFPLASSELKADSQDFQKIRTKMLASMPQNQQKKGAGQGVLPPQ
jgi:Zn-dependent protease with chaperone function